MLNSEKVKHLENFIKENNKICKSLSLMIENEIRLGSMRWGYFYCCLDIRLMTFSDKTVAFNDSMRLPFNIMKTYFKERKELPLHLKLWT